MANIHKSRGVMLLICMSLLSISQQSCLLRKRANVDGSKMKEAEKLWSEVPVHPALSPNGNTYRISKPETAYISGHYKSAIGYEELKQFYVEKLSAAGWGMEGQYKFSDWGNDLGGRSRSSALASRCFCSRTTEVLG